MNGLLVIINYSLDWEHTETEFAGPFADRASAEAWVAEFNKACKVGGRAYLLDEQALEIPDPRQRAKTINIKAGWADLPDLDP